MVNRRQFLGGALAVAAAGPMVVGRAAAGRGPEVDFYALGGVEADGGIVAGMGQLTGRPARVEFRSVEVGHFEGLVHEGDGRVAYLYRATLAGPSARLGLVKLDGAGRPATA